MFRIEVENVVSGGIRHAINYAKSRKAARAYVRRRLRGNGGNRAEYHITNCSGTPVWEALRNGWQCDNEIEAHPDLSAVDAFLHLVTASAAWHKYLGYNTNESGTGWYPVFHQFKDPNNGGKPAVCVCGASTSPIARSDEFLGIPQRFNVFKLFRFTDEETAEKFGETFIWDWNIFLTGDAQ